MSGEFTVITNPILNVTITSTVSSFASQTHYPKDLTIGALKGKLELVTGGSPSSMQLEVYNGEDKLVCKLENDEALLGSYPIDDGFRIHVIDKSGAAGDFEDVSKVEKFELTEDEYANRTDSVRAFKERMKLGRFSDAAPEEQKRKEEEKAQKAEEEKQKAESITIGNRCEVTVPRQPTKRGEVMYVGLTEFQPGYWVGIKYDEPLGKNDGSVKGKRYFECEAKYGAFVKPNQVTVGDFPELGIEDMDFDEM